MSKKIISIVAIIALVATLGICLAACNADSYAKKLEKAGYTVESWQGEEAKEISQNGYDLKWAVIAVKTDGLDMVTIICFKNTDDAKAYVSDMEQAAGLISYTVERSINTVFVGTEQGIKDAK